MMNTTRKTTYSNQGYSLDQKHLSYIQAPPLVFGMVDTVDIFGMVPPWIGSQFVKPCYWSWLVTTIHIGIGQVKLWSCRQICRKLVVPGDQHHELTLIVRSINISWTFNAEGMAFNSSSCWAMHNLSMKTITGRLVMSRRKRCQKPSSAVISMHHGHSKMCGDCSLVKCHGLLWS